MSQPQKYATQMLHMPITSCADMRELCSYVYLISTQCSEQCD